MVGEPQDPTAPNVEARVTALEQRIAELERQLTHNTSTAGQLPTASEIVSTPIADIAMPTTPPTLAPPVAAEQVWVPQPPGPPPPAPGVSPSPVRATPASPVGTEVMVKWAGLGLLLLAAIFLVSTAVSRGWIGPELQLIGAVMLGTGLITTAFVMRDPWPEAVDALAGVGLAVLFFCAGGSWDWLHLGTPERSLAAAIGIALVAAAIARELDNWPIALLGVLGLLYVSGWVNAFETHATSTGMVWLLVLIVVICALHVEQLWPYFWVTCFVVTAAIVIHGATSSDLSASAAVLVVVSAGTMYWVTPILRWLLHRPSEEGIAVEFRVLLVLPVAVWLLFTDIGNLGDLDSAAVAFVVALVVALSVWLASDDVPKMLTISQFLGLLVLLSVTITKLVDGPMLLVALATQAAAMAVYARRLRDGFFTAWAVLMGVSVSFMTAVLLINALVTDAPWGDDLAVLFVVGLVASIGTVEYRREQAFESGGPQFVELGRPLLGFAYVGLLAWLASVLVHKAQGQVLVSIAWALVGVLVIVAAVRLTSYVVLRVGLLTLALVVGKMLTVDLEAVDIFWRVGLFFVIGAGLLWFSYRLPRLLGESEKQSKVVTSF